MPRLPRLVEPGQPHHVTQRGSRRLQVFAGTGDYASYLALLGDRCRYYGLSIWCYCLMPNHVHLIAAPRVSSALSRALAFTHRDFARRVNRRHGWSGHLWQERFYSCPLDDHHLLAAVRYVLMNPVRARLVTAADEWPHSSCAAHLKQRRDEVVELEPLASRVGDWNRLLGDEAAEAEIDLRVATRRGRWQRDSCVNDATVPD